MASQVQSQDFEEDFYERAAVEEEAALYVSFLLNHEWYGIEICSIKDVLKVPPITYLPSAPHYIVGITNHRGNILVVADLKKIFGFESKKNRPENRIIVVECAGIERGILVDKVLSTVAIPASKIDPPMATLHGAAAEYIGGECKIKNKMFGILKSEKLVN
ncbi:chemotaxis protein CheW [Candidatus Margulisiibacteriota bacterium]